MDDGGIRSTNRGYNPDRQMWQQSIGQAYWRVTTARSRKSHSMLFPGEFSTSLRWTESTAMRWWYGPDRNYLWLLSRTPISTEMKQQMLDIATRQGFDVTKLIWVKQLH